MSFHKEDGVSSLCQKALHIVTELCFAGQVEWEKCSGIFPRDRGSQGGSSTGNREGLLSLPRAQPGPRAAPGICGTPRLPTLLLLSAPLLETSSVGCSLLCPCLCLPSFFHFPGLLLARRAVPSSPAPAPPLRRSPTPAGSLPGWRGERGRLRPARLPSAARGSRSPAGLALPSLVLRIASLGKGPEPRILLESEEPSCKWGCLGFREQKGSQEV